MTLLAYLALTIALAWFEKWRISRSKRPNVRHGVSSFLAVIAFFPCLPFSDNLIASVVGCLGVRLLVYAPALNKFRGLKWTYTSKTTTSIVDKWFGDFWLQLALGIHLILVSLFIL